MQLTLFKALKELKLDDDTATKVVEAIEGHIAMKVTEANSRLESQLKTQTWLLSAVGVFLAIIGLAPVYLKLFAG